MRVKIFKRFQGFTLIELLVTLTIMSVLALISVPMLQIAHQRMKEQELRIALREIRQGIDAYKRAYDEGKILNLTTLSGYPASLDILVTGVINQRDPLHRKIYFLRRIPHDPMSKTSNIEPAQWGERSFSSDAETPQKGEDVFDVYSSSGDVGLNGVPYKKW